MKLPAQLSRKKFNVHKNTFGHVLVLAGSKNMLGAAVLTSLACMRSGAGLVTLGVPKSLNSIAQKKSSNAIMTLPLKETKDQTISLNAFKEIRNLYSKFNSLAIGPGLSTNISTRNFILKIVESSPVPTVIDADAINIVAKKIPSLTKTKTLKILTPHPGEMSRLTKLSKIYIEKNRREVALDFAIKNKCIILLKGFRTIVASPQGRTYINKTGNPGMATAGSGDVLTGIIAALLAQGLSGFDSAKFGALLHGKAGDLAAKNKTRLSMISSDIIENIPRAVKFLL